MFMRRLAISIPGILFAAVMVHAQLDTATILGTVSDSSGALIAGAKVEVQNTGTSKTVELTTDDKGTFVATALLVGNYRVIVAASGFKTFVQEQIHLNVADRINLQITLNPGEVSERVVVRDEPPIIETASTTLGGVVSDQQVKNLPLNGRSVTQLLALVPGAVTTGPQHSISGAAEGRLFESGMKFLVDGGDSGQVDSDLTDGGYLTTARITRASVDAVDEFRVVDSLYSAEYGQSIGSVINFITKSGSNTLHGTLFEYFRNEKLDAHDFFNNGKKPAIRLNQFGGSLGGPIVRDKLFFFLDYEAVRQRNGLTQNALVPTAAYRSTLSQTLLDLVNQLPLPNGPTSPDPNLGQFTRNVSNKLSENTGMVKIDYQPTTKDRITGRYNGNGALTESYFGVGDGQSRLIPSLLQTLKLNYTRTFTPTVVNELGFSINRLHTDPTGASTPGTRFSPIVNLVPGGGISFGGASVATLGPSLFDLLVANTAWTYMDTLSWNKGRHLMKVGVQIIRNQDNKAVIPQDWAFFLGLTGFLGFDSNTPFFDFTIGWPRVGMRGTYNNFFAQDDIRINNSLTLNLGLRYQYDTAPTESHGRIANFDPTTGTVDPPGTPILHAPWTNLAPRIGLAYAPFASKRTVFRAGFGMFYPSLNPAVAQFLPIDQPNFGILRLVTWFDDPSIQLSPFTDLRPFKQSLYAMNKHWQAAYSEQWNLNIQQGLGASRVIQVGYIGNRSLHLSPTQEINPIIAGSRRYPAYLGISQYPTCCSANYNAFQASFRQKPSHGLTFNLNYTYSHSLDQGGLTFGPAAQNPDDYRAEHATSDYDVRHNLEFDYTYELPNAPAIPRWLGGGWQMNGITVMRSGLPVNVICGCDPMGIGAATGRPNVVPGVPIIPTNSSLPGNQINVAAFSKPVGSFGNAARNLARGPGVINWDYSLFKNFRVREGQTIQFRAEMFNVFNTPQFANPDANLSSPGTFGRSSSTILSAGGFGSSRQIQFALKYLF